MNSPDGTKTMLEDYQHDLIANVRGFLGRNYFRRRPCLRILDSGCDTSGKQLKQLAELTRGEVVGINPAPGFPNAAAVTAAGDRVKLYAMDGMKLEFPDASFDVVVSANVLEHVPDPAAYIRECSRVLKPNGMAWFETAPCWTGPRGHHIHADMIARHCPAETGYRNDGTVIPDWSHLRCNRSEMESLLKTRLQPATVAYILHYLYESGDLNRTGWRAIRAAFGAEFPFVQAAAWNVSQPDMTLIPKDGNDEYSVTGFQVTAGKRKPRPLWHAVAKRLYWRMRRAGI